MTLRTPPVPGKTPIKIAAADGSDKTFIVSVIRIVCLAALAYWSWLLLQPFLSIIIWSVIFAVALYPVFDWLAMRLQRPSCPGCGSHHDFQSCPHLRPGHLARRQPGRQPAHALRTPRRRQPDHSAAIRSVQTWPFVGGEAYQIWYLASTNIKALLGEWAEQLKVIGSSVLAIAATAGLDMAKFIIGIFVSGFLFRARAGACFPSRTPCAIFRRNVPKSLSS